MANTRWLERAAQAWCDPTTSNRIMDAELAIVFAGMLEEAHAAGRAEVQAPLEGIITDDLGDGRVAVEQSELRRFCQHSFELGKAEVQKRIDEAPRVGTGDQIILPGRFALVRVEEPHE